MQTQQEHEPVEKLAVATIRMPPADYRLLKEAAYRQRMSLNGWCLGALLWSANLELAPQKREEASSGGSSDGAD